VAGSRPLAGRGFLSTQSFTVLETLDYAAVTIKQCSAGTAHVLCLDGEVFSHSLC
jgi:hypothetical protein